MSESALTECSSSSIVKGRSFRLFLAGSSMSVLGTRMSTIAFPMLALWLTDSPVAAGWTAFAATVPGILVYLPAGALVDLWRPRRVMMICEFGRGVAIATIATTLLLGRASLFLLIGLAVIEEILEVFTTLAERRYVSFLVGGGHASPALVRMEARTHVMVLAGRPLGGFLFALMPAWPFIADTVSFVIFIITLTRIRTGQVTEAVAMFRARFHSRKTMKPSGREGTDGLTNHYRDPISWIKLWHDAHDGWNWLCHDRFARVTVPLSAGTTLVCQALIMVFLVYARSQHLSSVMIGAALAASGLGGAFGSVIASRLPAPTKRSWTLIRILAWAASVAVLIVSEGQSFFWLAFVMGILGFTGALGNVEFGTYLIQNAPAEMLARITSIGRLLSFTACALGPIIGGAVMQEYGIQDAASLLGIGILTLLSLSLFLPSARTHQCRIVVITGAVNFLGCALAYVLARTCAFLQYQVIWAVNIARRSLESALAHITLVVRTGWKYLAVWGNMKRAPRHMRSYIWLEASSEPSPLRHVNQNTYTSPTATINASEGRQQVGVPGSDWLILAFSGSELLVHKLPVVFCVARPGGHNAAAWVDGYGQECETALTDSNTGTGYLANRFPRCIAQLPKGSRRRCRRLRRRDRWLWRGRNRKCQQGTSTSPTSSRLIGASDPITQEMPTHSDQERQRHTGYDELNAPLLEYAQAGTGR
jgi:MFS family permease